MKVIFIGDVPNVARVGQTKEVSDGYARNFLFPRKLAVLANSQAAAAVEAHLKKIVRQRAVEEAEMAELARKIGGLEITIRAKVGENEKLYGSVTGADIAEALSKAAGCAIDKKNIVITEPIKQAGVCDVTVHFVHDINAVIKVNVISEDAAEEKPAKAEKKAEKAEAKKEKAEAEPKKEKAEKPAKEKKAKAEKPAAEVKAEEKPVAELKEEKPEKPAKEKKAKAEKAVKEEKPEKAEEKKEKKPRAKAKKEDAAAE